ncbi:alpha/beta fold hydrolase [Actinomadura rupiterrae]|uniref:alpha/beta fold hydrolase n=1 Tax=Actinomadura rupiterrae TaxID=559627 RepID=UPI0020A6118A|nr:alpha/beta hydrolase [Actinomadura rupiterrae]MCP2335129.1 pimeloyl-ACP methyl ester carboxylesterase [Actinomadura rupiterrae]
MSELVVPSADGRLVSAVVEGDGTNLLIVHPGGGDVSAWDEVVRFLPDFRTARIRRRIYVRDAEIALPHSMRVEASDIVAVARQLDAPVLLVGHSSGAVAAMEAALMDRSAFAGMFLYEPPMPTKELVAGAAGVRARELLDAGEPAEAMRVHLRDIVQMPADWVDMVFAHEEARAAFAAVAAAQIADNEAIDALGTGIGRFAALDLPTTLLEGDQSPSHLRERLADLADVLPDARVVTLAGHGHVAHITAPEPLAEAVREAARQVSS